MRRREVILVVAASALALSALGGLTGCRAGRPPGTVKDWVDDGRALEEQGQYFQEDREGAPWGALEYYKLCLDVGGLDAGTVRELSEKIDWFSAMKLLMTEDYVGKPYYREAIAAMTKFREDWPESPNHGLALFYRALSREYDIDFQDAAGAIADYKAFIAENPESPLAPEAWIRIGHCYEFDLDHIDYAKAIEAYDAVIARYGPTNDDVRKASPMALSCIERALYLKARILEDHLAETPDAAQARKYYGDAVECYRRLTDSVFFGKARFRQAQFVHYRLGCLLAEKLGRKDEGVQVLEGMAKRWRESPWYGRVMDRLERITGRPMASLEKEETDGASSAVR